MDKGGKILIGILLLPLLYEMVGMSVNSISTTAQTKRLRHDIIETIPDSEIVSVEFRTGNTTGTGNHVDCLSLVTFSTDLSLTEVQDKFSGKYSDLDCSVEETDTEGEYLFSLRKRAPFADSIIGH